MTFDLHVHSDCSDGSDSPREIVAKAKALGIGGIALTDHDNVNGIAEAESAAKEAGIRFSAGIEFSAESSVEVHVLGYNIDYRCQRLADAINERTESRRERFIKILEKLKRLGADVGDVPKKICPGRVHAANLLVERGFASSINEAFDKYLGRDRPAYVESKKLTPLEAVKIIAAAGGSAVIAHPIKFLEAGQLPALLRGLIPYGLKGLEVYYPKHSKEDVFRLETVAKGLGLFASGGSDYHGSNGFARLGQVDFELSQAAEKAVFG